jgi:hypothetical protein
VLTRQLAIYEKGSPQGCGVMLLHHDGGSCWGGQGLTAWEGATTIVVITSRAFYQR